MHALFKESGGGGGGRPHIQERHQSLANHILADMGYLYCIKQALSDMWDIFEKRMRILNKS